MLNTLRTAAIASLIGISTLGAMPAHADSLYLGMGDGRGDGRFGLYLGDNERDYRRDRYRDDYRDGRDEYRRSERRCTPERALYKAQRMGSVALASPMSAAERSM